MKDTKFKPGDNIVFINNHQILDGEFIRFKGFIFKRYLIKYIPWNDKFFTPKIIAVKRKDILTK